MISKGAPGISNSKSLIVDPTYRQQLEAFEKFGFISKAQADAFARKWSKGSNEYGNYPFDCVYRMLGRVGRTNPVSPFTKKWFYFDTEAIYNPGDYIWILENASRITNGELILGNIGDLIDIDHGVARVLFTCRGERYVWDLEAYHDWADCNLFEMLQSLAEKYNTKGRFTGYYDGQAVVIGYCTPEELDHIKKITELDIFWFKTRKI